MPRPTRRRAFLLPSAGLMLFSSMVLDDLHQVRDLVDHPAHRGRVLELALAAEPAQAQPAHRRPMRLARAGDAAHQLDFQRLFVRHVDPPRAQPNRDSTDRPRLAATSAGVVDDFSASSVARTMLYGLVEPWLLATMSVTPITSNTARIGPPAMMPSPGLAGAISTLAAPCSPTMLWWMVPFLSCTLNMLRRAASI